MEAHGWGRYPRAEVEFLQARNGAEVRELLAAHKGKTTLIPSGAGRSYGDSALAEALLNTQYLDSFIQFNKETGVLSCGAGASLETVLKICIPHGWMLPVLPGTRFVTIGGAIAADIHGKNHHLHGSFCDHLMGLKLVLASGESVECSPDNNPELFHATCGGMGLTGVVTEASIQLTRLNGNRIKRQAIAVNNLEQSMALMEENIDATYSVAWLDCLAGGTSTGRGVLYLGEHEEGGKAELNKGWKIPVPFSTPAFLLNRYSVKAFNSLVFGFNNRGRRTSTVSLQRYFFPLDNIAHWNRLYGSKGFLQYQFVLPMESARQGIELVLNKVAAAGKGSFLSVLKQFGPANQNLLSFPLAGYTLALDFKYQASLLPLLDELDAIVTDHGGRIYLAKDARMSEAVFKKGYPGWEQFVAIKKRYDPGSVFASLQSKRLGLTP